MSAGGSKRRALRKGAEKNIRVQVNADEITLKSLATAFVSPCKWGYQKANKNASARARAPRSIERHRTHFSFPVSLSLLFFYPVERRK